VAANRAIVHNFPRVMFVLMPGFGLLTWVLYRKARPFYAAHLYYSIHFHAFAFLAFTLQVSDRWLLLCITTSACGVSSGDRTWQPSGRRRSSGPSTCW
jgi:hypothetical protein